MVRQFELKVKKKSTSVITDISGNILNKEGTVELNFQLPDCGIRHEFVVCGDELNFPSDGLLGMDFLEEFKPTIDFDRGLLRLSGCTIPMSDHYQHLSGLKNYHHDLRVARQLPTDLLRHRSIAEPTNDWQCGAVSCNRNIMSKKLSVESTLVKEDGTVHSEKEKKFWEYSEEPSDFPGKERESFCTPPVDSRALTEVPVCRTANDLLSDCELPNDRKEAQVMQEIDDTKDGRDNPRAMKENSYVVPETISAASQRPRGPNVARIQQKLEIPPFSGCDVSVPVDIRNSAGEKLCQPLKLPSGVCAAHTVVVLAEGRSQKQEIVVRILNTFSVSQVIRKNTPILTLEDAKVVENVDRPGKGRVPMYNLQHLRTEENERFYSFLETYQDIFEMEKENLKATNLVKHTIDIENSRPIFKAPYRVP
ncbi:uncharacterized protein [Leptinotarsa decemlineata]|uniref:uncharacterized protein n=1 Tax=Leptinotarsa decemlineata TaxID=7539 RepID=UPI003D30D391